MRLKIGKCPSCSTTIPFRSRGRKATIPIWERREWQISIFRRRRNSPMDPGIHRQGILRPVLGPEAACQVPELFLLDPLADKRKERQLVSFAQ